MHYHSAAFEDDELLAYAEQQIEEETKVATPTEEEEEEEEDPLDAFMAGIEVTCVHISLVCQPFASVLIKLLQQCSIPTAI